MSEKPILFSGPMVRAILAGRKTETRRVIKPQPDSNMNPAWIEGAGAWQWATAISQRECPYGKPADELWVKETFTTYRDDSEEQLVVKREAAKDVRNYDDMVEFAKLPGGGGATKYLYAADIDPEVVDWKWTPPIYMPRAACRILLPLVSIGVERVQDIAETPQGWDSIRAEGITCMAHKDPGECVGYCKVMANRFRETWDALNAKRGYSWESNPWVWVLRFSNPWAAQQEGVLA